MPQRAPGPSPSAASAQPSATTRADVVEERELRRGRGDDEPTPARARARSSSPSARPDARRADEQRRPVELDELLPHGVTRSRSCSIRVGPIPGTASRSSTDRERAVLGAVVDDPLRGDRTDPGKPVELLDRRRREARLRCERPAHRRLGSPRATAGTPSPLSRGPERGPARRRRAAQRGSAPRARRLACAPPARATASATRAPSRSR